MRKDEFNELKIVNEDENLNFEFGETQESESTSYKDNSDRLRDEINDNKIFNETKSLNKNKKKQRKDKKSEKDGSSSNGSSLATSITTIVGASLISVTTLSTLIGINLFFNAKCKMNRIEPTSNSIVYELDLADINKDECIIKLENDTYNESHELIEGSNTGEFIDLTPSTEYHVAVIDVTYNSYILYEDNIFTKDEDVPPLESCIITFDANGGDGEQKEDIGYVGQEYILPECTFTAPNGYAFDCWQLSGTEDKYNPGEGYLVESQDTITFIALWGEAATLEFYPGIGAQGNVTSIKYVIGKEYTIPSGEEFFTAPENQEFDYWFDDMYSEQRHAGDIITIEDTYYSFTGHWKYLDGLTFTVTFETNGGSEIEPQVVQAGTNATKPDDPTKDDYIFEGWYSNSELTNTYNFITPVTEDITLYAKWSTTYSVSGEGFNGFPNSTVDYATESEINGVNLQVSAYSCYFNDPDDGHGLWIPLGYDSQSPEDCISYLANKTPINGSIKNIAITVGPSAYGGTSNTTLHVTFGTEPMLEHLTTGTTITYDTDATLVVECNLNGSSYFNITNVSENGLVIESIVVTYYVN